MVIDFDAIPEKANPNFQGGEKVFYNHIRVDENAKILRGRLEPGATIGYHLHDGSSEIMFILSGTATYLYDDTVEEVPAGCCHYCPKGHSHSMMNKGTEDVVFYAVVPFQ